MKLYHGSNVEIVSIDFDKCMPFKDFGKGFYLTPILEHARKMAARRKAELGGKAVINEFEFNREKAYADGLKILQFEQPDEAWVKFVMSNRDEKACQSTHDYDVVIGPIADDRVAASISLYKRDYISFENLLERLKFRELSIQYFFHTAKALKYLHKL